MTRSKTRKSAEAFAQAMLEEFSSRDDTQIKKIEVNSSSGEYHFLFEDHDFPIPSGEYDIDIDLIPSTLVKVDVKSQDETGFHFAIMSDGRHFVPVPVDCSVEPVIANITCTYTDGVNED